MILNRIEYFFILFISQVLLRGIELDELDALIASYREVQARFRESTERIENTTNSLLKTILFSDITVFTVNIVRDLFSKNSSQLNIDIYLVTGIIVLTLSIIVLIYHFIWRIGVVTDRLADVAALLHLEDQIVNIIRDRKRNSREISLSRRFIEEKIVSKISDLAAQSWSLF